jgi:hypothetical protein
MVEHQTSVVEVEVAAEVRAATAATAGLAEAALAQEALEVVVEVARRLLAPSAVEP